ncbi:cation diffusion facilitator family transporter [Streptomyces indicus]|uniref:Cation diffusion facilitator family transporter n=1 Tax=Streptomyces indicus TaxID=417292 RepID=A0A1G9G8H1_9ACTN|nr:cation diffusion facilitator family transporter [Streptomyces indicus]SDK97000.1 cation diffusion facilitator family transporter [Streptomyces indicus]
MSELEAPAGQSESVGTVIVAVCVNLGIAVAKAVGGIISGSSAMLSEAAHSVADTVTEVMLLVSLKAGEKPADAAHPLGYSGARYVWALLAAVATFVGGGVFAVYDGIHTLTHGEEPGDPTVSYIVLAVAFVLEASSLRVAWRQVRGEADRHRVGMKRYVRWTPDTAVKAVFLEDSAALVGLTLAAGGLLGGQLTGSGVYDGAASILIGLLLVWVAWALGRSNAELLIGRSLPPALREEVRAELLAVPHVMEVIDLVTLVQGPDEVLIAAKADFRDVVSAADVERSCEEAERRLRARFPSVRRVFIDPTPPAEEG